MEVVKIGALVLAAAIVVAGTVVIAGRLRPKRVADKGQKAPEIAPAQELVSLTGFFGPWACRRDGAIVALIAIDGRNCSFLTQREKDDAAGQLASALSGEPRPYTIHRVQVPLDPAGPAKGLEGEILRIERAMAMLAEEPGAAGAQKKISQLAARRELIEQIYLPEARRQATSRYRSLAFVSMAFSGGEDEADEARRAVAAFCSRMADAGYAARLMAPREVMEAQMWHLRRVRADERGCQWE